MTKETKPLPSNKIDDRLRDLIESIKTDSDTDRVVKSLQRHKDAVVRQYNDPVQYYGEMRPSEMAMLRTDLSYDIAAFEVAINRLMS